MCLGRKQFMASLVVKMSVWLSVRFDYLASTGPTATQWYNAQHDPSDADAVQLTAGQAMASIDAALGVSILTNRQLVTSRASNRQSPT
jgi:hypothetical protein